MKPTASPDRRQRSLRAAAAMSAFACALTSCSAPANPPGGSAPTVSAPAEGIPAMNSPTASAETRITITLGDRKIRGALLGNTTGRALADQLPLTLTFSDHGGQEKIAPLPAALSVQGMPAASDAQPLTIGYYAPEEALVLYYEYVGRFNGIVPLGTFDDLDAVRRQPDGFSATLDLVR